MIKKITLLVFFGFLAQSIFANNQDLVRLAKTINQRLDYMESVAVYKALNSIAIEDLAREKLVLKATEESAFKNGLNHSSVSDFFKTQITLAKVIQYRHRADFLINPELLKSEPRDLVKEVRPALISLGAKITTLISEYLKKQGGFKNKDLKLFVQQIQVKHLRQAEKALLFKALQKIKLL